jgi:ribosome-associated protein
MKKTTTIRRRSSAHTAKVPAEVARAVAAAADKKAVDLVVLDLRKASAFTDFFVIVTGATTRQVHAIAEGVRDALARTGAKPALIEGLDRAEWVLVDYFDFVVHVFTPATREFYGLERLWGDAERVEVSA